MDSNHDPHIHLPVKSKLLPAFVSSFLIAILMTVVSVAGLRYRALIYPTDELIQAFVSNDVVNLFIGLPILLGSMYLAWRGRLIGLLGWPGALFFVFYNYTVYVFAMPLNWVFPLHLILMTLSAYALIGLIAGIDGKAVQKRLTGAVPERFAGGVLAGLGFVFLLRVIGVMVGALTSGTPLAETEVAVNLADFLTTPAWVIGGILLWKRKEFGYVTGLGWLFQGSMLFVALIIFLLLQPLLTGTPYATTDVIVIAVMGLVCFIPFGMFVRGAIKTHSARKK